MDQWYLHVKTVFLGGETQRSCWPFPSAFPQRGYQIKPTRNKKKSALILRDSCPPLPRVELIQKVSTKHTGHRVKPEDWPPNLLPFPPTLLHTHDRISAIGTYFPKVNSGAPIPITSYTLPSGKI